MKKNITKNYLPFVFLAFLIISGAILSRNFLTYRNFTNILQYNAELSLVSLGLTFVILSGEGGIDLSVGSVLALTGILVAQFSKTIGFWGSLFLALFIGALIGLTNGLIIVKGKVEPFITTLVTMTLFRAVTLYITKGGPILNDINPNIRRLMSIRIGGFPLPAVYVILVVLFGIFILKFTKVGRYIYAIGDNKETVYLAGINVKKLKISLYVFSGIVSGIAGLLTTARLEMGEPRAGSGMELAAIAAIVAGGTSLAGGKGSMHQTFIGILIFAIITNLINLLDLSMYLEPVIKGLIIIIAGAILTRKEKIFSY
jgi:ribose/xylose/arabinose/galactoside ABC-type transport system permease subunit